MWALYYKIMLDSNLLIMQIWMQIWEPRASLYKNMTVFLLSTHLHAASSSAHLTILLTSWVPHFWKTWIQSTSLLIRDVMNSPFTPFKYPPLSINYKSCSWWISRYLHGNTYFKWYIFHLTQSYFFKKRLMGKSTEGESNASSYPNLYGSTY